MGINPKTGMTGHFLLNADTIDSEIQEGRCGNYALSCWNSNGYPEIRYVGRSDTDLNGRLKNHIGKGYETFEWCYADTPDAAYLKECDNYHNIKAEDNQRHPCKPAGSKVSCPDCDYDSSVTGIIEQVLKPTTD